MSSVISFTERGLDSAAGFLDRARQYVLRFSLRNNWMRQMYSNYESRTLFGFLFWSVTVFPVALLRPDILLVIGPLIFGYPHLLASYRFLFDRENQQTFLRARLFLLFLAATVCTIVLYQYRSSYPSIAFSVWPSIVALGVLISAHGMGLRKGKKALFVGSLIAVSCALSAWYEPIYYAGAILMIHNFIAFIHWLVSCRKTDQRFVAIFSTFVFLLIHVVVLLGGVDLWIHSARLYDWKIEDMAWFLASWSQDSLVWYRWLLLYTFGLSMHYFVWLRALPEAELQTKAPLCFRLSLKEWRTDLGHTSLKWVLLISLIGFGLWFIDFSVGQIVYFQIALLHGALELVFLPSKIFR